MLSIFLTMVGYCMQIFNLLLPGMLLVVTLLIGVFCYKRPKLLLTLLVIYFAIIAISFKPSVYDDLYRYWEMIDRFRVYGWDGVQDIYKGNFWYNTSALFQYIMYGLSFVPEWCTAVIISGITHTLIAVFDVRFFKDNQVSNRLQCAIILFQFISIDLYSTISSWLYMLTFAIIVNVFYTEIRSTNRWVKLSCWVAYVFLGQMHTVAYVFFAFRALTIILPRYARKLSLLVVVFWRFLSESLIKIAGLFKDSFLGKRIYDNLVLYINTRDNGNLLYMIGLALFAIAVFLCIRKNENRETQSKELSNANYLMQCFCAFIVGAWGSQNLMFRFTHLMMMLLTLNVGKTMIDENKKRSFKTVSVEIFLYYVSFAILIIYYVWISYRLLLF